MNPLKTTTLIAAASIAAFATLAQANEGSAAPAERPLTRAEVIADMQVWNESGAAGTLKYRDDARHLEFLAAFAKYQQMRAAPEFAQRVAAVAREIGERVDTAASK
jgi:hypothetical protein